MVRTAYRYGPDWSRRVEVEAGNVYALPMPYSEVCMALGVAGFVRRVRVGERMAQLLGEQGEPWSAPITYGEAGIYGNLREGFYAYEPRLEVR